MRLPWSRKLSATAAEWIIELYPDGTYRVLKGNTKPHFFFPAMLFVKEDDMERFDA